MAYIKRLQIPSCILLLFPCLLFGQSTMNISGSIDKNVEVDTVTLLISSPYSEENNNELLALSRYTAIPKNGRFEFKIEKRGNFYYKIFLSSRLIEGSTRLNISSASETLMGSENDNIQILIRQNSWRFSGIGSQKNNCIYAIKHSIDKLNIENFSSNALDISKNSFYNFSEKRRIVAELALESFKSKLSKLEYDQIYADIIGKEASEFYKYGYHFLYSNRKKGLSPETLNKFERIYIKHQYPIISSTASLYSKYYVEALFLKEKVNYLFSALKTGQQSTDIYSTLKSKYAGILRDRIVTYELKDQIDRNKYAEALVDDALSFISDPESKNLLGKFNKGLKVGSTIDKYVFIDSLRREVKFSDFIGKTVIVDMWYSGCGACISVNEALNSMHDSLKSKDVVFISISIDRNRDTWLRSVTKGAKNSKNNFWAGKYYPSPGTVVVYTNGTGSNNEFVKTFNYSNAYPKLIIIDKNGKLFSSSPPRPDIVPNEFLSKVQEAMLLNINTPQ